MTLDYIQRRCIAFASLIIGIILVIGGMLLTGRIDLPSWLQGLIILCGFLITSFGTKLLRCAACHKFPDKQMMLETGKCSHCQSQMITPK